MSFSDAAKESEQGQRQFHPTHWSVVLAAANTQSPASAHALEDLCRAYWFPLYAYIRRQGVSPHEAQDLTQAFFEHLLEKKALASVQPEKGKFRSFLLASLNNFLNNERDKARRFKRGGGAEVLSLDAQVAEDRYEAGLVHGESPEKLFERRWAQAVVEQVAAKLSAEWAAAGHSNRFEILKDFLMGDPRDVSYDDAAKKLGMSVSAVTSAIHRLRSRFRELFRSEIANIVESPAEIDEEIRYLAAALAE
ncbi:MAG TPA: sigma-70 family RNA polymerase sigma factor [Verrucomicrobiae bacterium]|nr:sigma-70 family RNA polymerase sigma factor [Verrucomicrobiae bacterium]